MKYFCPSCGTGLQNEYNFCPSCGYNLQDIINEIAPADIREVDEMVIVCDSCGEENPENTSTCLGCGVKLTGKNELRKKTVTVSEPVVKRDVYKKEPAQKIYRSKPPKQKRQQPSFAKSGEAKKSGAKNLGGKETLFIIAGTIIVAAIILLLAGVFDSPSLVQETFTNNAPPANDSGINLANMQQISQLEEQVKNNPGDTQALVNLAHLKNDSGFFEKAIENYNQYLDIVPNDADARVDMGVCYYNLKNYDLAIAEMEKALKYKPDHQIAHLNLGIVNLAAGNIEVSQKWLKKAVELNPNSEVGKRAKELLESH
ncbi:MAG: tetratricopeptide repeat protein [Ignavibacteriaceae bacterium]|nr:tetratricopeptide repeat protein [Ignavibacteriaceae bacterium]